MLGGIMLMIGSLMYGINIIETYNSGGVQGVSILWAVFFVIINYVYTYIFYKQKLMWSFWGSLLLSTTEYYWLLQMLYYKGLL